MSAVVRPLLWELTPPGWYPVCDWGYCDRPTSRLRYAAELGLWLPVCSAHAEPAENDDFKPRGPVKAGGGGRYSPSPRRPR